MENELQVIRDIKPTPVHSGHDFHEVVEKTEERSPLERVSEGDVIIVRIKEAQSLVEKGKQGFRGGKNNDRVLVKLFIPVDPVFQQGANTEDLAMRIRALMEMDFRLGYRESFLSRHSKVGQLLSHPLSFLKNEESVFFFHEGSENLFLRLREGKKTCEDDSFKTTKIQTVDIL
jgi:hypothetical protein